MARPKPFPYDTLLRVRQLEERQKAQRLAEVRNKIFRASREREFLDQEQFQMLFEAASRASGRFDARDVRLYYIYERLLARRAAEKDAEIVSLGRLEKERRRELEHAMKRRRIVERLEARYIQAMQKEFRQQEQKLLDGMAVTRAAADQLKRRKT